LTFGTPDSNGKGAQSLGTLTARAVSADVRLGVTLTDVRNKADLSDYAGSLQGAASLRITDRLNGPGLDEAATLGDLTLTFPVPCTATAGPADIGSTCTVATTADAITPGMVPEGKRTIWELSQVEVRDGAGAPFAREGLFVP
jgi:hypothetical protein